MPLDDALLDDVVLPEALRERWLPRADALRERAPPGVLPEPDDRLELLDDRFDPDARLDPDERFDPDERLDADARFERVDLLAVEPALRLACAPLAAAAARG